MAPLPTLTAAQVRLIHLAAQGLLTRPARVARPKDVLATVRRMALLQLDTIHVVARSHHLVLHARLGDYQPEWLDELLAGGAIFETWAHEACLAPVEDHGLHRRLLSTSQHWAVRRARGSLADEREGMTALLEEVRRRGPVKTSDFTSERPRHTGWWGWKREKEWLEAWLALGELMVARREKFQRVYDLTERVLPAAASRTPPDEAEARLTVIEKSVRALGVTQARWVHDYFRTRPRLTQGDLRPLVEAGRLLEVRVRGWKTPASSTATTPRSCAALLTGSSRPRTPRSSRHSTRWSGTGSGHSPCSASTTGWSATFRPASGATATSPCPSCDAGHWWVGSTPRPTGPAASSR